MIITNKALPRRTFLRGVGAAMALPVLDSMFSPLTAVAQTMKKAPSVSGTSTRRTASSGATTRARRSSCGRRPTRAPTSHSARPSSRSSRSAKTSSCISGLAQVTGRALGDGPGDHARATATWLTGVHPYKTGGADFKLGISADQIAAQEFGKETQLASLELALEQPRPRRQLRLGLHVRVHVDVVAVGNQPAAR